MSVHTGHLHGNNVHEMKPSHVFDFDRLFDELDIPWVDLDDLRPPVTGGGGDTRELEVLPTWGVLAINFGHCTNGHGYETRVTRQLSELPPPPPSSPGTRGEFPLALACFRSGSDLLLQSPSFSSLVSRVCLRAEEVVTPLPLELFELNRSGFFEAIARFLRNPAIASSYSSESTIDRFVAEHPTDHGCERPPSVAPDPWNDRLTTIDGTFFMISEATEPGARTVDVQAQYRNGLAIWQHVGRHMYFLPQWEEAAREAERELLGLMPGEEVPKVSPHSRATILFADCLGWRACGG